MTVRTKAQEEILLFLKRLAAMALLLWAAFGLVFGLAPMRSNDMAPRLSAGDLLLYYRLPRSWLPQEVVVFQKEETTYAARVVAQPGDTVEVTEDARLVVNGSTVTESGIYYTTPRYETEVQYPLTLGEGQYFVLGDLREGAKDSRFFGPVETAEIKGRVITVLRRRDL